MKTFKGTKGKWMINEDDIYKSCYSPNLIIKGGYEPYLIADIIGGLNDVEIKANAQLIAAAPELLEALQLIIETKQPIEWAENNLDFITKAQKAINKALGQ